MRILPFVLAALAAIAITFRPDATAQNRVDTTLSHSTVVDDREADVWPTSIALFDATGMAFTAEGDYVREARLRKATITAYTVTRLADAEASVAAGLPTDAEQARDEILRRLQSGELEPANGAIKDGWRALMAAQAMRVERVPAVVFDGGLIVYGVASLDDAIRQYRRYHARLLRAQP